MPKFNARRGIEGVKKKAKKLPGQVVKQLPNAAMVFGGGLAVTRLAGRGVMKAAGKAGAKKVIKKGTKKKTLDTGNAYWNRVQRYEQEARKAAKDRRRK